MSSRAEPEAERERGVVSKQRELSLTPRTHRCSEIASWEPRDTLTLTITPTPSCRLRDDVLDEARQHPDIR